MKLLRALYDWVLHWSETPHGKTALFLLAFAESSFFPIPPDVLLIALCIGLPKKSFNFAFVCTIGSVLGGVVGYAIGLTFWDVAGGYFFKYVPGFSREVFALVQEQYERYSFWAVFTAGFTPIPYKVFTISAGVFKINFTIFVIASFLSRAGRFFIVSSLIWKFGAPIKNFIDRYFNLLSILFVALLVLGFLAVKLFIS